MAKLVADTSPGLLVSVLKGELLIALEALSRIKWVKDCGIDGRNEAGEFVNWTAQERDEMYRIASQALRTTGLKSP